MDIKNNETQIGHGILLSISHFMICFYCNEITDTPNEWRTATEVIAANVVVAAVEKMNSETSHG